YGVAAPEGLDSVADVRYIPTVTHEYLEFARNIRKFDADIAFAPLRDTVFNHNKSPLKYFEYTALGLPCVFSKIPPYKGVVEDGQTGFLASSSEEWFDKLTRLIEDPVLRKTTLEHAQEDVNKNHLLSKHTDDWGKVYSEVHERGVVSKSERAINLDLLNRLSRHVGVAANFQAHQVEEMNNALHSSEEARITQGAEIEALKVALHNSQLEVVDYATSTSWKITRPIRRVLRKLRRR
ncbi:MAG TPA: glycosyltransferase, partial [Cyclobacteriaceae bacterium]|nr:glycosyltransferase [Cyclobacteriaceae bacterium]